MKPKKDLNISNEGVHYRWGIKEMARMVKLSTLVIAVVLIAIISGGGMYGLALYLNPPQQYNFLNVGQTPTYGVSYMQEEVAWELAKKEYRTVINTIVFSTSNLGFSALQRGDIVLFSAATYDCIRAKLAGINLTFVAARHGQQDQYLAVRTGITSINDLAGKTMAVGAIGSGYAWASTQYLISVYPALNGTMNIIAMAGSENRAGALIRGQIDVSWVEAADVYKLSGYGITPLKSLYELYPGVYGMSWVTMADYASKNPGIIQTLVNAQLQTDRNFYKTDDFVTVALEKLPFMVNETELRFIMQTYRSGRLIPTDPTPTREGWNRTLTFYNAGGILKPEEITAANYDTFVDFSFSQKAGDRFGPYVP